MITDETSRLAAQASALGSGQPVQPVNTKLSEFGLISDALVDADTLIQERTSELQAVLDTVPVAVWFTYDPSGRQVVRNRFAAELMEIPAGPVKPFGSPDPVIDTIAFKDGEVVSREDRPLTKAMRGEHTDHEEFLYRLPSGAEVVLLSSARPIYDSDGRLIGAVQISLDITERKRAENQRRLLAKELDHRVKNNLAIVQALVQQSLRNSQNLEDAQTVVGARLSALASAHDMLTRNAWLEGDLRTTVETIVLGQVDAARVEIVGPNMALPPGQVMALSLAMHELTTNAIKYGALSNEEGRVSITWEIKRDPAPQLFLTWKETGGPPVKAPGKRGFGSRLLERITASEGGSSKSFFDRAGLTCELTLPIKAASG
jgi:two-component sensor histidine kinase/PAS domain-containing protein